MHRRMTNLPNKGVYCGSIKDSLDSRTYFSQYKTIFKKCEAVNEIGILRKIYAAFLNLLSKCDCSLELDPSKLLKKDGIETLQMINLSKKSC